MTFRRTVVLGWAALESVLAVTWLAGGPAYPYADRGTAVLDGLPRAVGAGVTLLLALLAAACVVGLRRGRRGAPTAALVVGAVLAVVVPDYRLLAGVAYLPIVGAHLLAGDASYLVLGTWPALHLLLSAVAGTLLVGEGWRAHPARRAPRDPVRTGRRAVAVAVAVPAIYATTRILWYAGVPVGLTPATYAWTQPILTNGLVLGLSGLGGAVLTLGLVQRWGERFPRWVPGLGGRPVPVGLATRPATAVAVLVISAGLMFTRQALGGHQADALAAMTVADWGAWAPELLWPVWGAALLVAAHAYRARRATAVPARA